MKVYLFGMLADQAAQSALEVGAPDTDTLIKALKQTFPFFETLPFSVAVNRKIITANTSLTDTDEVALMPPFAGG